MMCIFKRINCFLKTTVNFSRTVDIRTILRSGTYVNKSEFSISTTNKTCSIIQLNTENYIMAADKLRHLTHTLKSLHHA